MNPLNLLTGGLMSWLKIAVVVGLVTVIGLAYWHYTSLLREREQLQFRVAEQSRELANWQTQWDRLREALKETEVLRREARKPYENITALVQGHDWQRIAQSRPGLLAARLNRGTAERLRDIRCISDPDCTPGADSSAGD